MSTMISVRIPKRLRDEARRLGINISEVVRRALEEEIRKRKLKELEELGAVAREILNRIGREELIRYVRESRDER